MERIYLNKNKWNWWDFLRVSDKEKKRFRYVALEKAALWSQSATAGPCKGLPQDEYLGGPEDEGLRTLEYEFFWTLRAKKWKESVKILGQIELRAAALQLKRN